MPRKTPRILVAPTPVVGITISHDQVIAAGALVPVEGKASPQQAAAHHVALTVAAELDRPVRATATDPLGRVKMVIHPDGHVSDVEALPPLEVPTQAFAPEPVAPMTITAPADVENPWITTASMTPPPPPPPAQGWLDTSEEPELDLTITSAQAQEPLTRALLTALVSDGQVFAVDDTFIIGRNPANSGQGLTGTPVRIKDQYRSISRSHFALGADDHGVWVQDLRSTNGTAVAIEGAAPQKIAAGEKTRCPEGAIIFFGDHQVSIRCAE